MCHLQRCGQRGEALDPTRTPCSNRKLYKWRFSLMAVHVSHCSCLQTCSSLGRARCVRAHAWLNVRSIGLRTQTVARPTCGAGHASWSSMVSISSGRAAAIWPLFDRRARAALSFSERLRAIVQAACGCTIAHPSAKMDPLIRC